MKKNIFKILAIYMMGFGVLMGIVFPFFVTAATDVPVETIYTPLFFTMCITAGILVGVANIMLARRTVGSKMQLLSKHMKNVEGRLNANVRIKNKDFFLDKECYIDEASDDAIGECAKSFNSLVKSLSDATQSESYVKDFTEMLSSRLELDQLAEKALLKLMENMDAEAGLIIIEREGNLNLLSSYGISNPLISLNSDAVLQTFKHKQRRIINVPDEIYLNGVVLDFKPKSILVEPILYKGIVLGAVVLAKMNEYDSDAHDNMELFSNGLALAFKNAITHDQLQKLAAKDPLTNVLNRRFGMSRFREEYARAIKTNQPLGVIMADIDHFKNINDTYGHLVGDKVLVNVVENIKSVLRDGDIILRYGGEEFFIVLPGASLGDIRQIADRVRRVVYENELHLNNQVIKTTISLGGASFPENSVDEHTALLEIADIRLLKAKELGRNLVVVE